MAKEDFLIAVASSDGIVVNSHFGRARTFYIYKVNENEKISLEEKREVEPVCEGGNHDEDMLHKNLLTLRDCSYLLVSRIGNAAANAAEGLGIKPYEIPGVIEESVDKLIMYQKINELFE